MAVDSSTKARGLHNTFNSRHVLERFHRSNDEKPRKIQHGSKVFRRQSRVNPASRGMVGTAAASLHMKGLCKMVRWKSNSLHDVQSTGSLRAT